MVNHNAFDSLARFETGESKFFEFSAEEKGIFEGGQEREVLETDMISQ